MKIFDKNTYEEMKKVPDGEEYIFEFIDSGCYYQYIMINYDGEQYRRVLFGEYEDVQTGEILPQYVRYTEDNDMVTLVKVNGEFEIK